MKLTSNFLSNLRINTDKNWNSWNIYNLGRGKINLGTNQPFSSGIFPEDVGRHWKTLVLGLDMPIKSITYCGGGIVIYGDGDGRLFRSTDYGETWSDLGLIIENPTSEIVYCGFGIVVAVGSNTRHIYRSTDYGSTWTDLGEIFGSGDSAFSMTYCVHGILLVGTYSGHIYKSTDYGETWSDVGAISSGIIWTISYLGNKILLFGTNDKHIFRSINYGDTWTDLGELSHNILCMVYCGNGILLFGDDNKHIFRSVDYGLSWSDLGIFCECIIRSMIYCGNGIVFIGGDYATGDCLLKSYDYGLTWSIIADSGSSYHSMTYCGNGLIMAGSVSGAITRSDTPFKLGDVPISGGDGEVLNPVMFMDFWSECAPFVPLSDLSILPSIIIDELPADIVIIKAVIILKYGMRWDGSGDTNYLVDGKIQCSEERAEFVDAIYFQSGEMLTEANAREGGDVHIGYENVSNATSQILGNCTVIFQFLGIELEGDDGTLELYDVQLGIRVYFRFAE